MIVFVTAADTMQDSDPFRRRAVLEYDFTFARAGGVPHPLKLDARNYVIIDSVAKLLYHRRFEGIEAGRYHDISDFNLDYFLFLLIVDSACLTELLAGAAFALEKEGTMRRVNHRHIGHGLRGRCIDCLSLASPGINLIIR